MTLVIGAAGHIDHGKTALLRALTGIDADRLPEERRRGMTIDVGYAHLVLDDGSALDFVDVPGHDRLVGNMLVGAGEIDAALVVVAADDGPRAQTVEHLLLLDALGIDCGLAVVTKVDLVEEGRVVEVAAQVARLLAATSLAGRPVLCASSLTGLGIAELRTALEALPRRAALPPSGAAGGEAGTSRLAIDRVFVVRGRGAVVTGTLRGGSVGRGWQARLLPGGPAVRVRGVQVHGRDVAAAAAGRVALNLTGVGTGELRRGMVLTDASDVLATRRLLVALRAPARPAPAAVTLWAHGPHSELPWPAPDRARVRLHMGTDQQAAVICRAGRDALELPGGFVLASLRLERAVAAAPGDRFVLRRPSPGALVAGGIVLDAEAPAGVSRRRQTAHRAAQLLAAVTGHDERGVRAARLALHGALRDGGTGRVEVASDLAAALDEAAMGAVAAHHGAAAASAGMPLPAVRHVVERALRREATLEAADALSWADARLGALAADGRLVREADAVRLPEHLPPAPDAGLLAAMDRLEAALTVLSPPPLSVAARAAGCPAEGVRLLERDGRISVVEPDLAYAATTYRALVARALTLAERESLTPAAFRDATGTSRKYVLAILEDLDRRAILRRTRDGHVPGPRASRHE